MKKRWIYLLTALTLAVGVCAAKPMISGAAPVDVTRTDCSMTIYPEDPKKDEALRFGDDLNKANILVDVYKVASAVKTPGYDAYSYKFENVYSGLEADFLRKLENQQNRTPKEPGQTRDEDELKASDWQELAQAVGKIALGNGKDVKPGDTPFARGIDITGNLGKNTAGLLDAGLYLLIARSNTMPNVEDYLVTMQSATDQSVNGNMATIANSEKYTYIFAPQLISVPMRQTDIRGQGPDAENGPIPGYGIVEDEIVSENDYITSDLGAWIYNVNVYLKPVRVLRYGSLEIQKKLQVYESEEEVLKPTEGGLGQEEKTTFIFEASWDNLDYDPLTMPESEKRKSKIDSLTFPIVKEDGTKVYDWQLYMDRIPVGVDVTVKEVYSGASYEVVGSATQTIRIQAEKIKNGIALLDQNNAVKTIVNSSDINPPVDEDGKRTEVDSEGKPIKKIMASVAFTNTYNWDQKKGYGIKNQFTYDKDGDWIWTSDPKQDGDGTSVHDPMVTRTEAGATP
ncbi:hypothetical protein D5278_06460 [bacterium 1XD21-13]|nr:hypothetical protein [bacterium 1XD21-13]